MSRPLKMIFPSVGSVSLMIVRASVVLPQPDSPTRPSVSPAWIERSTPSTAWMAPTVRFITPARIGKCLTRPSSRRISEPVPARSWIACERRRLGGAHPAPPAGTGWENFDFTLISSSAKWQAAW